jgi:PhzF family phenazine biosynthesis protein
MKSFPIYQIDAFTETLFKGNPAAVVVLDAWLTAEQMQLIAAENNLSETAFIVKTENGYHLRWFTPVTEVDLCGHATLSAAHVIFEDLNHVSDTIKFSTEFVGELIVKRTAPKTYTLNFPSRMGEKIDIESIPSFVLDSLSSHKPIEAYQSRDLMLVYSSPDHVLTQSPDFKTLHGFDKWVIVTSQSHDPSFDFISRFYCAGDGIDEDPVTGSAHCTLVPYWAKTLNKTSLNAYQASPRGGSMNCLLDKDRVFLTGKAVTFLKGELYLTS